MQTAEETTGNLQVELFNFHCDINIKFTFSVAVARLYPELENQKLPVIRPFGLKMTTTFGSTAECEQFFSLPKNNTMTNPPLLTDRHLISLMTVISCYILHKKEILSRYKRRKFSSQYAQQLR